MYEDMSEEFLSREITPEKKLQVLKENLIGLINMHDFTTIEEDPLLEGMYLVIQPLIYILEAETWGDLLERAEELMFETLLPSD